MMEDIKVSCIVPIYRTEKYLTKCVESILSQTYTSIEIILIDDGSPDSCPEICDRYAEKDSRVRVIHQKNRGVSAARNAGLEAMTGDYFMLIDSDDTVTSNAVELLLNDAIEYGADIASGVKSYVDSSGNIKSPYDDSKITLYGGLTPLKMSLEFERQTNSSCAKLFKREFVEGIRFEEGRSVNEDIYFVFQCYARLPKLVQHNVSVYFYYQHANSNSKDVFSEKYFDMIYFSEMKVKYINEHHPELNDYARNMDISTNLFFLEVLCRTNDPKYRQAKKNSIHRVRDNYKTYRTINQHERMMAKIVRYGMYPLFSFIWELKNGKHKRGK